jgi:DNA helicase HerA-like ATPase
MIQVGHLASDTLIPIRLNINKLFASHIGIFGNTGSGKSYTLSKIYRQLFVKFKDNPIFNQKSHFLFFDFNGEYSSAKAITDNKKVYNLSTNKKEGQDKIPFSESDLLDLDLLCIFANATEKTQRPFINRSIHLYKVFQTPKGLDKEKWLTCKVPCLSYPKIL